MAGLHVSALAEGEPKAGRLRELGEPEPVYRGSPAGDADSRKTRVGGDDLALRRLEIDEGLDIAKYSQQLKKLGDASSLVILNGVIEDEQDHYRELSGLIRRQKPLGGVRAAAKRFWTRYWPSGTKDVPMRQAGSAIPSRGSTMGWAPPNTF
jgi:vacuolar iron transporter family protein